MKIMTPQHETEVVKQEDARTQVATRRDPEDNFVRTAIVMRARKGDEGGSLDVVDGQGRRIAQINLCWDGKTFIADVIDVDNKFKQRRALSFNKATREHIECGDCKLVSADFRTEKDR